jgi:hypothetical protein
VCRIKSYSHTIEVHKEHTQAAKGSELLNSIKIVNFKKLRLFESIQLEKAGEPSISIKHKN